MSRYEANIPGPRLPFSVSTPSAASVIRILGRGMTHEGTAYSRDELRSLARWARIDLDHKGSPGAPLLKAAALRDIARDAEHAGRRLMGVLARYLEPGEDPVKLALRLLVDAGFDTDPEDNEWAEGQR